jgi:excisionase family DNA binding protein
MSEEKDWLTIDEAAARLGVSKRAVYKYIQTGRLAAYKAPVGGASLVKAEDLKAFAQPQQRQPRAAKAT